jgi:hypothetical protein
MGSGYDDVGSGYSINKIWIILFGILNCIPELFSQYPNLVTVATETKRKESLAWLESVIRENLANTPEEKEFYNLVKPIMYIQ